MSMNYLRYVAALTFCLAMTLGCTKDPDHAPTFEVTGKVTYNNAPVEGATVVLVAQSTGGRGAVGNTDAEGNFKVGTFAEGDGAVAGSYKVKVFKYEMVDEPPNDEDEIMSEKEEQETYTGAANVKDAPNLLPRRYEDPYKSGFSVEVVDAPVTLDLDLK